MAPVLFEPARSTAEGPARLLGPNCERPMSIRGLCCAGSPAGSTQWRLLGRRVRICPICFSPAHGSTAGSTLECIEAAVISGKQAAQSRHGVDRTSLIGEDLSAF